MVNVDVTNITFIRRVALYNGMKQEVLIWKQLQTKLLAQIPLGAPDNHPSEPEYSPSIYKANSFVGDIYANLAKQIIHL